DVTTGLNYSKMKVQVKAPINQTITQTNVGGSGQNLTGTFKGDAVLGPEVGITSIPIEVSSAVTALYLLKLYAGLGADITVGSADMVANLQNQSLTGKIGTGANAETVTGDVKLDLGGSSGPDFFAMRAFLGMHLDFKVLNIFVQANHSFTTGAYGVTTGARVYF
ncbi:MAG: hypothetical protein KDK38_13255, partial [Leptospiraceae bacterium]|nr:hypothetical protein [Leptospiraceae bacterium]